MGLPHRAWEDAWDSITIHSYHAPVQKGFKQICTSGLTDCGSQPSLEQSLTLLSSIKPKLFQIWVLSLELPLPLGPNGILSKWEVQAHAQNEVYVWGQCCGIRSLPLCPTPCTFRSSCSSFTLSQPASFFHLHSHTTMPQISVNLSSLSCLDFTLDILKELNSQPNISRIPEDTSDQIRSYRRYSLISTLVNPLTHTSVSFTSV